MAVTGASRSFLATKGPSTRPFAPDATAIWFWPRPSTVISAMPVEFGRQHADAADIDALGTQLVERGTPKIVDAHCTDERHRGAHPCGSHGLIRALAALVLGEDAAGHGLAALGQHGHRDDEVDVDGSDNQHRPPRRLWLNQWTAPYWGDR